MKKKEMFDKIGVYEDFKIPRVCFSTTIDGCIQAMYGIFYKTWKKRLGTSRDLIVYVHEAEKELEEYKHKTNKEIIDQGLVFDAFLSGEVWVLEPVKLKKIGKIKIDSMTLEDTVIPGAKLPIKRGKAIWEWQQKGQYEKVSIPIEGIKEHTSDLNKLKKLYQFMQKSNMRYGFVNKKRQVITLDDNDSDTQLRDKYRLFSDEYHLLKPEEVIKYKVGVCWDYAEFERRFCIENNIEFKIVFIKQKNKISVTHTFLVYNIDRIYYWFEFSYKKYAGLHESLRFHSIKEVSDYVHEKMALDHPDNGFVVRILEETPKFGMNAREYMKWVLTQYKVN